jgi:hypothetical protein
MFIYIITQVCQIFKMPGVVDVFFMRVVGQQLDDTPMNLPTRIPFNRLTAILKNHFRTSKFSLVSLIASVMRHVGLRALLSISQSIYFRSTDL